MFAIYVFYLVKTALVDPLCCFTTATGVDFRIFPFCSSGRKKEMSFSMNALPRSTLKTIFLTIANSTAVSESTIVTHSVTLALVLRRSFDADRKTLALP